jgi:hypothetical protein
MMEFVVQRNILLFLSSDFILIFAILIFNFKLGLPGIDGR